MNWMSIAKTVGVKLLEQAINAARPLYAKHAAKRVKKLKEKDEKGIDTAGGA